MQRCRSFLPQICPLTVGHIHVCMVLVDQGAGTKVLKQPRRGQLLVASYMSTALQDNLERCKAMTSQPRLAPSVKAHQALRI